MKKLKTIVEEIELTAKDYKSSHNRNERETYNNHVDLIILEAPQTEQYNLCNYWERLKR